MMYPSSEPKRFNITSSISAERPVKYCINSILNINQNEMNMAFMQALYFVNTIGKNRPNGIKTNIFDIFSVSKICTSLVLSSKKNGMKFIVYSSGLSEIGTNIIVAKIIRKNEQNNPR
ncbi:hypothetical protein RYE12_10815 [Clostridioides difficile]|nr:hypothetical protein [Clostridioides difficile]MDU8899353.1 hypothetical protein [Clostridioides difficile]